MSVERDARPGELTVGTAISPLAMPEGPLVESLQPEREVSSSSEDVVERNGVAKKIAAALLLLVVAMIGWYVASDRMAPYSSVGAVSAFTTQIAPRVAGEVVSVHVVDNQRVRAGDVLFELDPRPFDLAVAQAAANLAQTRQGVEVSIASLRSAEARLRQAQSTYDNMLAIAERTRQLMASGVSSQAQVDRAETDLAGALSNLQIAQADHDSALLRSGEDEATNPQLAAARVQFDQAVLNRDFAIVRAPADGVITNLRLSVGQFVAAGTPSLTFIASERPWIMVDLRENQLANVEIGDSVSVLFDGQPGRLYSGRVQGVAWGIDPGRTAANGLPQNQPSARWFEPARTIPVHIEIDDDQDWPRNVRVGSKVSVVVYAAGQDNPVAWIAGGLHRAQSFLSYLY